MSVNLWKNTTFCSKPCIVFLCASLVSFHLYFDHHFDLCIFVGYQLHNSLTPILPESRSKVMQIETDQPARHVKLIILIEFAHIIIINFDRPAVSWSAIRPPTKRTLPGRTRNRTQDMPRFYRHGKWTVTVRAKWATSISVWVHVRLVRPELNLTFSLPVVHPSLNSAILNTILDHAYLSM